MKAKVLTGLIFCLCMGTLFLSTLLGVAQDATPSLKAGVNACSK
jgi:hypothetical protein